MAVKKVDMILSVSGKGQTSQMPIYFRGLQYFCAFKSFTHGDFCYLYDIIIVLLHNLKN